MRKDNIGFKILAKDRQTSSRVCEIRTPHGILETPLFLPVATSGSVKTIAPWELSDMGFDMILCNTYHLYLRPGHKVIEKMGGLHRFMGWGGAILTDSGGFQVFSLKGMTRVDESGVKFRSIIDGSEHLITPEYAIEIQKVLGSDIIMILDDVPPYPISYEDAKKSMRLSLRWAERSQKIRNLENQAVFGIMHGSVFKDLRKESAERLIEMDFTGYAIGGLSVGEEKALMYEVSSFSASLLPEDKPRYLMGVGTPEDLVRCVSFGIDMFDCVLPTRNARNGQLFTSRGKINIRNSKFSMDEEPVDPSCVCYTCRYFSKGYLRHLFWAREMLGQRLATIHNLFYYSNLMGEMRRAIKAGRFIEFEKEFFEKREGEK